MSRFISLDHNTSIVMKQRKVTEIAGQLVVEGEKEINFQGPYYDTTDTKEIEFLRKLGSFGTRIFEDVVPDDVVQVKQEVMVYICGFPKCKHREFTEELMKEHKQQEHSKEARARKQREALEEAAEAYEAPRKKKKAV